MGPRAVSIVLITLLVILHGQLWFGRGSISSVVHLQSQLIVQNQKNLQALNNKYQLLAELRDLKEGLEMIEDKARMELGMIKINEIYVQISR
jgi:cell division protein FtsB